MTQTIRLFFLFVLFLLSASQVAGIASTTNFATHQYDVNHIAQSDEIYGYDTNINLRHCCHILLTANTQDWSFLAFVSDFLATKSGANRFPKNADDLLSELPRDAKGRIYPSSKVRIRPEQHSLKPGETYAPRHHGQHYHVETRADPTKSWNNKKNVIKIKPVGYQPGQGTGFLPGEKFPGAN